MYLLSMTPLDPNHIDEICEDLINQQKTGVSTHAMMMMYFAPEGTPPINKAEIYCERYDAYRERLDAAGAKHGVLVQSTMGHGAPANSEHPFQKMVSLMEDGTEKNVCCPLDEGYRQYIKEQMRILAQHNPRIVMIDDDVGLLYRADKGCFCPKHMEEFRRRTGASMTRERLIKHIHGNTEEDKYYTDVYIQMQGDALVGAVKAMREGLDSVDPTIQGVISLAGNYCEFTDRLAEAFAGKGNPKIARFNNGNYTAAGARWFSKNMLRAATQKEIVGDKIDIFLAETDTCPHNRYSTSASTLHAHMTGTILEGAKGAKHWITRTNAFEPSSGKAYRAVLSKYRGFYDELARLTDELQPVGCRIPLSKVKDYMLTVPNIFTELLSGWASCVLERYGVPLYFSGKSGGAVFLDDNADKKFTDEQITEFLKGTVFLSAKAAKALCERGFSKHTGVTVREWDTSKRASAEILNVNGNKTALQSELCELVPISDKTVADSKIVHISNLVDIQYLAPGSTIYKNDLGGTVYAFAGTPHTGFNYKTFSFLSESRKLQIVNMLKATGNLPVYYPGDMDVYMRAGYLKDNRLMCAMVNTCLDPMEEITLVLEKEASEIEMISPDGKYRKCKFYVKDGVTHIEEPMAILSPVVLFIS